MDDQKPLMGAKDVLLDALFDIAELSSEANDLASFFPMVHRIIGNLLPAENFYVALYHEFDDTIELVYMVDLADPDMTPGSVSSQDLHRGLTGYLLRSGDALLLSGDGFKQLAEKGEIAHIGPDSLDWLGIPLKLDHKIIGAMVVQSYDASTRYNEDDKQLLTFVARQVVNTLERIRHRELLEQQIMERTQALHESNQLLRREVQERKRAETFQSVMLHLSELAHSDGDPQDFYVQVHDQVSRLIDARNFYIALLDRKQLLTFPYFVDQHQLQAKARKPGKGLTEYLMRNGQAVLVTRKVRDELIQKGILDSEGTEAFHWLGGPLVVDGQVVGALVVQSYDESNRYRREDLELISFVSRSVSEALSRRQHREMLEAAKRELEAKVTERTRELEVANGALRRQMQEKAALAERHRFDAMHDALTGLANRAFFTTQLNRVLKSLSRYPNRRYVVAFIDLDRFKIINDSMGHLAGDQLLKQVAQRLQACIRETDMVARLGGDEFVILFDCVQHDEDVALVGQRIINALHQPFEIQEQQVFSGCSLGVAHLSRRYKDASDVLRDADTAMYQAKSRGRGQMVFFDDTMRENLISRFSLQNALRLAVESGQIFPAFQPIFSLPGRKLHGFELLARWPRAGGGELTPELFLEAAEETGIIVDIDTLMVRQACRQLSLWGHQLTDQPLFVSVNLSARSLQNSAFMKHLVEQVREHELTPGQLMVEIRENVLIQPSPGLDEALNALKEVGVGLILDHFGAGSATLSVLMQHHFQALKMSPHFLRQVTEHERGQSLLQSVIAVSRYLKVPLIAHGIEEENQLQAVQSMGCAYGQGEYLCQPLATAQAELMLCA
ncbi:EAL domain-containing protein [Gallaecimonas pentaromativorans]|uniref:diguanylate cyclase n=1 Tax=Gallaecimonas pentaromativorans TaxID=584787 RepID=A0A3N1NUM6_9GAMM|nr:EAL domain-containing protein [Gallaecimonas pentaromativorans]ROQ19181.1 diguanylate cyclase/phosphodiesterase with GAF sensor [Gallaecimonas pentaromativorans]